MRMLPPRSEARPLRRYSPVTYERTSPGDPVRDADIAWLGGALGLVSVVALSASFMWAHHWGPRSYATVGVWIASTLAALILGVRSMRLRGVERGLAWLALLCVALSAFAVFATGAAYAAGFDVAGACGGG